MKTTLERSQRLYRFLEELQKQKSSFPLTLNAYAWRLSLNSLPVHPAIDFAGYTGQDSEYLLRVERRDDSPF
ncbi:hypothetical protein DV704_05570 [Meiothermus sp. QL-1]|uniref:hypothetical protein n=1 Tax=Meiothermus sp. QL-1 TaxID=2058095 RepID=UPI000E0B4A57|nr:hypothetical protein [Meiothermus sp. QL-1]RDI95742.1 hypothetical protein DV704_05570 [Meiothermus sp. QL-1]